MIYFTAYEESLRNTAGAKAPTDIKVLCLKKGYQFAKVLPPPENMPDLLQKAWKMNYCRKFWKNLEAKMQAGDVLLYQHPMYISKFLAERALVSLKKKGVKLIALIHDLETLRGGIEGLIKDENGSVGDNVENKLLHLFDVIICHNESMKSCLIKKGFSDSQLVCLGIFDYLTEHTVRHEKRDPLPSVAVAGNLHKGKCEYIYHIFDKGNNPNLKLHLFGVNYEEEGANPNQIYHGSFPPQELPSHLEGQFGLVWDGASAETCAGNTGAYLRFNNPHKCSLYLASQLPVIIWNESALAGFITDNKVGITVSSLYELESAISAVTDAEYAEMCRNTAIISEKLRSGSFFYQALSEALDRVKAL